VIRMRLRRDEQSEGMTVHEKIMRQDTLLFMRFAAVICKAEHAPFAIGQNKETNLSGVCRQH
jgi:hypothetical protein